MADTQTETPDGAAILKEMVDGLKGVSEGPWDWIMSGLIRALRDDLAVPLFEVHVPHRKYQRLTKTHVQEVSNGQHIARCSPDNIRAIAAHVEHQDKLLMIALQRVRELEALEAENAELDEKIDAAFCSLTIWASAAWNGQIPGDARDFQRKIQFAFNNLCDVDSILKRLRNSKETDRAALNTEGE